MNTSISDNSSFTIFDPDDVLVDRYYPCAGEADGEWALDKDSAYQSAYQASFEQMEMPPEARGWREWDALDDKEAAARAARARAHTQTVIRTRSYRTQTRVRARRSPASARRAACDSGGDDGDGAGGDPEPEPRRSNLSPVANGGAL